TTIRSRTHHYPFRLLPPSVMRDLVEKICREEGVQVDPAVYPLVIRAGGGSARDTLSVLDQLLAGADDRGVTYERAVALLGVSDVALIDEMVDALAAEDSARCTGRWTGWSRPGTIPGGSPPTCWTGSGTCSCCSPFRTPRSAVWWKWPGRSCPGCSTRPSSSDPPPSPGSPRSCTAACRRCAGPPRPACSWNCCAPACCCPRRRSPRPPCCSGWSAWNAG